MNRPLFRWLRWGFAAIVVAALLVYLDLDSMGDHLRNVQWWVAAPAILSLTLLHIVAALTWRHLARTLGNMEMSRTFAVRAFYISQALGSITPGNLGGDAYRVHAVNGQGTGWQQAAVPIVAQRLTSYVALALLGVIATLVIPVSLAFRAMLLLIPAAALLVVAATWAFVRFRSDSKFLGGLAQRENGTSAFWRAFLTGSAMGLAFHGLAIVAGFVLLTSVAPNPEVLAALAAISIARVASVLPITPSGIGVQEAGLALLLPLAGVDAEAAVAFAALSRLAFVLTSIAGVTLLLFRDRSQAAGNDANESLRYQHRKQMQSSRR